ncbi:uncharacterized protein LOC133673338 [Populus nigra]|uniref:uncharacterized protein LOC133673338 n=1 Tax=Populus nigra TaxID=3691 RepID=UPI002B273010|nr:uncharacterized protein LOC133673338 [Populus nigra]
MSEETKSPHSTSLVTRPGIFSIGSSSVGMLSLDCEDSFDSSNQVISHGWIINTKYYTADVALWMAHLHEGFSIGSLPFYNKLTALVMVFDLLSSLVALKDWIAGTDISNFLILLCVGNKVDRIPGHPVHAKYRKQLRRIGELGSFDNLSSLLDDEEESLREMKRSCIEWCTENGIEYIEACALNVDLTNVSTIFYLQVSMILKFDNKISRPTLPDKEAETRDDSYGGWVSANGTTAIPDVGGSVAENNSIKECENENREKFGKEDIQPSSSAMELLSDKGVVPNVQEPREN